MSLLFTGMIFLPAGDVYTSQNNSVLEQRIEQLRDELDNLSSLLEKQKREYIKQHPIEIKPSVEPNVMWELTKETEGKESYQYLAKFIESFPNDPRVKDAMWYMVSMAYRGTYLKSQSVDADLFIVLEEYAKRFPADGTNIAFAKGCLYYEIVDNWFWSYSANELKRKKPELIEESRNNVLEGIKFFKEAITLAEKKESFRGFNTPRYYGWAGFRYYDWGKIRESAYWNIGEGYERLEMWEKAIETYSFYLLEYPESDEIDRAKAKIYLLREKLEQK